MDSRSLQRFLVAAAWTWLAVPGCGSSSSSSDGDDTTGSTTSTGEDTTTEGSTGGPTSVDSTGDGETTLDPATESSTSGPPTSTSDDGTSDTGELPPFDPMCDEESTSSEGSSGSTDESGTDTGNPGGGPDGSPCNSDTECASDRCYLVPLLGGICGECVVDGDCEGGGCSPPNPLSSAPSQCNQGEQGGGCQSDAACCGIGICNPIIVAPGIITVSTCGQCEGSDDCPGGAPCQPSYDFANFSGVWECVAPDSLPDGHGCTPDAAGDGACESGHCTPVSIMGIITLGVCSECETDADCDDGQTCTEPEVDLVAGPIPGMCV